MSISAQPTLRPQGRAEAAEQTAARLLATARQSFATQGFAHVSLDALAAEAGVTRGALHHHFQNKAGLFEAVFRAVDAEIGDELDRIYDAAGDPWHGLTACYHAYLDLALQPANARILFRDAPAVMGARAMDILMESGFATIVEELAALIAAGRIRPLDPVAAAHLLNGAVMAQALWLAGCDGGTDAQRSAAHAALAAIFDGLTVTR
ncbi:TetR/AcrR family transcriptional regulator [Fuscovulum ytuae]|uniref:TetR/AcrR family transcriptional regulator n=1 Tax=Fuscovulum ytuae TaxID=3042299 RepID=A0ABY8Q9U7_9RHOB|nr:TetR/AcrR family transcriptional regulator [Fuscovulum sp. YMD61]WGV17437.1 TetR/AcrR family transcriptional regulator [Fuscovulum sp. YMD61]